MRYELELVSKLSEKNSDKPPLLFVHGMWHAAWCWEEYFMPYFFENGYDVYALSLRGHGKSEGKDKVRWFSVSDYVEDISYAVEKIGREPVLIGHSMGGYLTQKYLETHDAPGAVLLAGVPPHGVIVPSLKVLKERPLTFAKILFTMKLDPVLELFEDCRKYLFSESLPEEKARKYCELMQDEAFRAFVEMLIFPIKKSRIKTKMLVFGAEYDEAVPPSEVVKTARAYNTEAIILPETAHDIMLEPNWENAAKIILDWLGKL